VRAVKRVKKHTILLTSNQRAFYIICLLDALKNDITAVEVLIRVVDLDQSFVTAANV